MIAEFGMYPFESVRWAWDALWNGVHVRAPWTPAELAHSGDVYARWIDPLCVVNHVCGWPLARWYAETHRVVGAFALDLPEADGHRYRSVLVSPHDRTLAELVSPGTRAVANSADSLSGWISLLAATVGRSGAWPGTVAFTSAHLESLRVLAAGDADLACIDSWTLALISRQEPELVAGLHRVGVGPLIPSPAVTVAAAVADERVDALADALDAATTDPTLAQACAALHVTGFVRTTLDDYLATLDLAVFPT